MAENWSTRQLCLDRIILRFGQAKDAYTDSTFDYNIAWANYPTIVDPIANLVAQRTLMAFLHLSYAVRWMLNTESGYDPPQQIPYFLENYTIATAAEPDPMTWEDIVAAWSEAPVSGRLFTVLSIDAMRKEIWNEPVSSFDLQKGADDWP